MMTVTISLALLAIAAVSLSVIGTSLRNAMAIAGDLRGKLADLDAKEALAYRLETCGQSEFRPELRQPMHRTAPASAPRRRTSYGRRCVHA